MKFIRVLKKGAAAAASSYKLILTMWLITLMVILLVAMPLKNTLKGIFGNSMVTERLTAGFDAGLASDMGQAFGSIVGAAASGGFWLTLVGFFLYTFFTGGLFARFATAYGDFKVAAFMKASANNFLSFLMIAIIMMLLIGIWTALIIGLPVGIMMALSDGAMPGAKPMILFYAIWALAIPVWLLVADFSRRWIAATGSQRVFRALGAGFGALGKGFFRSYSAMLFIWVLNIAFFIAFLWFGTWTVPEKGGMIFLLFLATQALFILRLFLKAWRYATVSELALIPA
jgi:hypothetical protein